MVYTSYLNTLHHAQFRQCNVNVACSHLPSTVHRLLQHLKKGHEYDKFMGLTPPIATTKASTDTYCGSEAAYPIAASYLDTSILSLTAPIPKKTNKAQHAGSTPPNTHTHARVGSTYTHPVRASPPHSCSRQVNPSLWTPHFRS